ncbi:MAG: Calx-beta domain-containing protein [Isosphaeraceae bacterium]
MPADRRPRRGEVNRLRFDCLERRELLTVQFSSGMYNFGNSSNTATVTLVRTANTSVTGTEVVQVATTATGTARADVDYTPVKQNVTFGQGEYTKQVTIPLLNSNASGGTTRTIGLTATSTDLSGKSTQSSAQVNLIPHADITPPAVTGATQLRQKGMLTGFQLTFSKDMDPVQASKAGNYVVTGTYSTKSKGFSIFGRTKTTTFNVPISQAVYDPATKTVTLTVKRLQVPVGSYTISNPQVTDASGAAVASALKDTSGNMLDVNADGTADGVLNVDANTSQRDTRPLNITAAQVKAAKKAGANLIAANASKSSSPSISMSMAQNNQA